MHTYAEYCVMERANMNTQIMSVTDLRRDISAVIRSIREQGDVVYITQHGRPAAVMLDYEQYGALVAQAAQGGWPPNFFYETYGALTEDPLVRPDQGDFETRETLG